MKNELERLLDGSKQNNVTLSILFLNSNAFFPAAEILSATKFNGNEICNGIKKSIKIFIDGLKMI